MRPATKKILAVTALGFAGIACSAHVDPLPVRTAWIKGHVEDTRGLQVTVLAVPRDKSLPFVTTVSAPNGDYEIGPMSAAEYDLSFTVNREAPLEVSNYPGISVLVAAGGVARADIAPPGGGSITVRIPPVREPGRLLRELTLFEGDKEVNSLEEYDRQIRIDNGEHRTCVAPSREAGSTLFTGLPPGAYTACTKLDVDGVDVRVRCQRLDLEGAQHRTLDLA